MDASANVWHLERRAVPLLNALAADGDEARLNRAVTAATAAGEHLTAARDTLLGAIEQVERCIPGSSAEPTRPANVHTGPE